MTYGNSKEDMGKWQETVVANRHLKSLDLAQDRRAPQSYRNLVQKFTPSNDLEKEVQMVLISSGAADEEAMEQQVKSIKQKA